jgi:hypothetical protein
MEINESVGLNNIVAFLLIVFSAGIFFLKGVWTIVPLLISTLYITTGQGIEIGFSTFYVHRILCLVFLLRMIIFKELKNIFPLQKTDVLVFLYCIVNIFIVLLQKDNDGIEVFRVGRSLDIGATYLCFRVFIRSIKDVESFVFFLFILFFPISILMSYEKITQHNFFSVLGGVPELSLIRDGTIRAQGPFSHPITAGTAAATFYPFFLIFLISKKKRILSAILGFIGMLLIVFSTGSSGPILTFACCTIALSFWPFRENMRFVQISIVLTCILSEIFMRAHFWYILAKINIMSGSNGWQRAELITQSLLHFNEWWLAGTSFTRHWMPTGVGWSERHTDITNMFIGQAVKGGIPLLAIFILIIALSFKKIGKCIKNKNVPIDIKQIYWVYGSILFSHVITFFSIAYFDQIQLFYYMLIAMISSSIIFKRT